MNVKEIYEHILFYHWLVKILIHVVPRELERGTNIFLDPCDDW